MDINKKKHQIEVGVAPIPQGYRADPEEIKRRNLTEWSEKNYPNEGKKFTLGVDSNPIIKEAIKPKEDRVNHPKWYTWLKKLCGVEVIDICRHLPFNVGCAVKYLLRKDKEDIISLHDKRIEDLRKAIFYIEDEIKRLESQCIK